MASNVKGPFSTNNAQKKQMILAMLRKEGYATYARRLQDFKFVCADIYKGAPIPVAACFTTKGVIVLNPGLFPDGQPVQAVSLIVRHELLHALLGHEGRMMKYLRDKYPDDEWLADMAAVHELGNYAMDYDISIVGYDDFDKEIVRTLHLNGRFIGGLIAEDDHPEWLDQSLGKVTLTMEQMLQKLSAQAIEQMRKLKASGVDPATVPAKPTIVLKQQSDEYVNAYNKAISVFNKKTYSDADIQALLAKVEAGEDIYD